MGGDHGAAVVVPGAELSLARHPDIEFLLFGDRAVIEPLLAAHPRLKAASRLVHTDVAVKMDDKPSQALRKGRWKSSMWLAIDAVKKGEADVAVSAGNTGALMAMAKFNLRTMARHRAPGDRRALADAQGRHRSCSTSAPRSAPTPQHLVDLAVMGGAMARVLFDLERPTVGLLNIGVEEVKGLEEVREAGRILREASPGRTSTMSASSRATTSARARSTWWSPKALPAISRSRPPRAPPARSPSILKQRDEPHAARPGSAICWRATPSARCATRWTRARRTAASSSASTASSSRATAAPTPKASPPRSISATTWCATTCSPRSARRCAGHARDDRRRRAGRGSGFVTMMRSVVLGCGSYLPSRVLTNADWRGWSTPPTNGSCSAPASASAISRPTARPPRTWRLQAARAALADAGARRAVDRPDRAGDLDARQHLSGDRGRRSRPGSASPTAPPSTCRRSARASSMRSATADGLLQDRRAQARAGDRRGDLLAHPRLDRPRHLRAVRRRRRRGGAGGAAAARHARGPRHPHRASALRRPPQGQALCRRRPVLDADRRAPAHGGPRGVQARGRR